MSQSSLPPPPSAAARLWAQVQISRADAHEILGAIETLIKPKKQPFELLDFEMRECLALTVAFLIKVEVDPVVSRMSHRLSQALSDVIRARDGETVLKAKPLKRDEVLRFIFAVDDGHGRVSPQRRGRPNIEFRNKIVARLIDFLQFASGEPTHQTSDSRADAFLTTTITIIRDDFRSRMDPRYKAIARALDLPTTTRFLVQDAKRRLGRRSSAQKVFREIAKAAYLNIPIERLKFSPVIFIGRK